MQSAVKEKEDAHQDPEIQPMKEDDGTFGEYRLQRHSPSPGFIFKRSKEARRNSNYALFTNSPFNWPSN
ncbi:hypothetical protein ILYODFUR_033424 [Ilyodon furcidens]|uniref:Uncharacterized protein n=1 Tax=Ilyodon furcidens TaxID=33524 RepID=A0ABV0UP57_9TELE